MGITVNADLGINDPSFLYYVQNKGQWDANVLYRTNFRGGNLFVEQTAFTYLFYPAGGIDKHPLHKQAKSRDGILNFHALRMEFEGALETHPVTTTGVQEFYHNYFIGSDPKKWASQVALFTGVTHKNMYPGIDVKLSGRGNDVRYDFIVAPGADPSGIRLKFTGHDHLQLRNGQLLISTSVGEVIQQKPLAYQRRNDGSIREVACGYVLKDNRLGFIITSGYDKSLELIIDPTLIFSTYTGSIADNWGMTASFDQFGNGYTAGVCFDVGYPTTTGAFQKVFSGPRGFPGGDISISKFNSNGTALLFSTYLGGKGADTPQSITVDNNNCLIVLGRTYSTDFPVINGYDMSQNGGTDIIVTKFNPAGSALLGSTFIGGTGDDGINFSDDESTLGSLKRNYADDGRGAVHVDELNNIYVASCTNSQNFPVTLGCFQGANAGKQDGCVFKMNSALSALLFSSYLGGSENDAVYNLAIDWQDRLYVTGGTESPDFPTTPGVLQTAYSGSIDGFITHFSMGGNAITESSYIGTGLYDQSYFVQIDFNNDIYLFGQCSGDYPIVGTGIYSNPNSGQFVHKMDPNLSTTIFSTEFGSGRGSPDIVPSAFLVDNCGNIYMSGWGGPLFGFNDSNSSTFGMPVTSNAFNASTTGSDFYFGVLSKDAATLAYATFFGGPNSNEHVDGGTSCFDKNGIIYQAICASCGGNQDMPTYPPNVWSKTNKSNNCNNGLVKFQIDLFATVAQANVDQFVKTGCAPFATNFLNLSTNSSTYFWSFGDGNTSTATTPSYTYTFPGTYTVMLIASDPTSCNQTDTAYLSLTVLPPGAVAPQLTPATICKGDSVTLSIIFPPASSYTWQPPGSLLNPNSASPIARPFAGTIYTLNLNDTTCFTIVTRTVMVDVKMNNTDIFTSSFNTCNNDTITIKTNTTYASYAWSNGETTPFIKGVLSGLYTLATTDNNGCKGFDSIRISRPPTLTTLSSKSMICHGQTTQLIAPVGAYTYRWYPPDYLSSTTVYNPVVNPPASGVYTLVLTSGTCSARATHSIIVNPSPALTLSSENVTLLPGEKIRLFAKADTLCNWYPPYGLSCTTCNSPIASPEDQTVYYCYVVNKFGCSNTGSIAVDVMPTFYIPNTFTPNGDGLNELFRPSFSGYVELTMTVFDRWGNVIYTGNTLDAGWNGMFKGKEAEQGAYVYKVSATDYKHRKIERTGPVILLR